LFLTEPNMPACQVEMAMVSSTHFDAQVINMFTVSIF
jgi:hypothetical protein